MEKRALLALAISFIIFIGFGYVQQKFFPQPPPVTKPNEEQQTCSQEIAESGTCKTPGFISGGAPNRRSSATGCYR